jgi:hypothetical protein
MSVNNEETKVNESTIVDFSNMYQLVEQVSVNT